MKGVFEQGKVHVKLDSHLLLPIMQLKKCTGIYNVQMFCFVTTEFHGCIFATCEFVTGY